MRESVEMAPPGTRNTFLVMRFFFWVMVYHFCTVHKQLPWHFIIGLLSTPLYFVACLTAEPEGRLEAVRVGAAATIKGWEEAKLPQAPDFVVKRFREFAGVETLTE